MRAPTAQRGVTLAALALVTVACNDHVFRVVPPECHEEEVTSQVLEIGKPVDILIVVDNSGSMCEEQSALKESFLDPNCPLQDLDNPPANLVNPTPEQVRELSQDCGFVQILSLFEATDFRLGVITTDVSACDNPIGVASNPDLIERNCFGEVFPDRRRHPQRGCLQPPDLTGGRRYLQLGDEDLDGKFAAILDNVQTWGSPFERGLDATIAFLNGDTEAAECENDAREFLRDDARLAVIYLTDEDDCSHGDAFGDENATITCQDEEREFYDPDVQSINCYEAPELLTPTDNYVGFLQAFKGVGRQNDVKVAVIGGALEQNGVAVAGGCTEVGGQPNGECNPSFGNSNFDSVCGPEGTIGNCCEADGSNRYFDFSRGFGSNGFANSICTDFRSTMIGIAEFIGRVEDIQLRRPPPNPAEIIVRVERVDGQVDFLERIADDDPAPETKDGFLYDGDTLIQFFGPSAPQPGDDVTVHYAANAPGEGCGADG